MPAISVTCPCCSNCRAPLGVWDELEHRATAPSDFGGSRDGLN